MTASPMPRRIRLNMEQKIAMCKYTKDMRAKGKLSNTQVAAWATRAFKLEKSLSRDAARNGIAGESKWAAMEPCQLERKQLVSHPSAPKPEDGRSHYEGKVIKANALCVNALQERHRISKKRKHGEAASVDQEAAETGRVKLRKLTDSYAQSEIYNMNETSFFFRSEAKYTLTQRKVISGRKDPKHRLTLALAVNADGSGKLPLLYIGSAKVPRAFVGWKELGVLYANSKKGWMNTVIFKTWLHSVNLQMWKEGRSILLLVDNVSSHTRPAIALSNARLAFFAQEYDFVFAAVGSRHYSSLKE
ncbi:DNA binding protein [Phytophthora infestans T30-4]|uniref:DNA binding protein n=1 Tax=Phytophthora infestans (strain T30-4) TaxID=403677 RepID=D0RMJ5_PHYIT|nr:DNA binding protein [Phytophthora infestans T30-4]EEY64557.1 DNA binding protein [Phytophthora infestans T30-4]|eukprot:XP_002909735.1 DNA binding protein [Phytophthora infestans T30-4]